MQTIVPGEYFLSEEPISANVHRKTMRVIVRNTGDRAIQVGSHTHFFEVNKALGFERRKTLGYRLNIPAGTAIRFEPGDSKEVDLVELGGRLVVHGFHGLVNGRLKAPGMRERAIRKARKRGFGGV